MAQSWMQNGEVVALGWTLLHFCWQGVAIAALYIMADRVLSRTPSKTRYGVAMAALVMMFLAATLTFLEQERLVVRIAHGESQFMASQLGTLHETLIQQMPMAAPAVETGELWIAGNAARLLPWVDGIWLAGVLLLAVRAFGGWFQLQKIRRHARGMVSAELQTSFRRVASRIRVGRRVALRISDEVMTPFVMGVWRATVILPVSAVMQLDAAQLEAVLAHELAHVRRWDYLLNLLQTAVECLFFFHPAVWWVSRRARELREICCDEVAMQSCGDPVIYAEALLQLEEQRVQRLQLAAALHGNGGSLLGRVKQVLGEGDTVERGTIRGMRVGAVGITVLALCLGPKVADALKPELKESRPAVVFQDEGKMDIANQAARSERKTSAAAMAKVAQGVSVEAASAPAPVPSPAPVAAPAARPAPAAAVSPMPLVAAAPMPHPTPAPNVDANADEPAQTGGGAQYIQKMREAGYPLDLDKDLNTLIALRSVGVTPEYAKAMAQVGMGVPTPHDLVSLKSMGVTPEYVAGLKNSGIAPANFHEVISEKSLGITPEYTKSIASMGLGNPTVHDLVGLKAQGITPEYVSQIKASGIAAKDLHELISLKAVGVTPEYAKAMGAAGFGTLSTHDLISLRAQGVTPEYVRWLKQNFPDTDMDGVRRAAVFHVDADFIAKAKSHGFTSASLDKLVKLKMTGLLD
jgi:beta-lactamase regulating signal transducer with metallopeptidase domain